MLGKDHLFFTSMNLEVSTRSSTEHISYMLQSVKSNSCWFHRLGRRIAFFEESCWNTMRNWLFRYLNFRHQFIYLSFIQYQMKLWYTQTLFAGAMSLSDTNFGPTKFFLNLGPLEVINMLNVIIWFFQLPIDMQIKTADHTFPWWIQPIPVKQYTLLRLCISKCLFTNLIVVGFLFLKEKTQYFFLKYDSSQEASDLKVRKQYS